MFDGSKYKLGDLVLYNNNRYRIKSIHSFPRFSYSYDTNRDEFQYEYDLVLDREPRVGELDIIRGVDERAIKCLLTPQQKDKGKELLRLSKQCIKYDMERPEFLYESLKKEGMNTMFGVLKFEYKKIIFSGPCTIILWKDGTKTIAKTSDGEMFDPEKGVAICFMKRALGETDGKKVLRKANKDFYDEVTKRAEKDLKEGLTPMDEYLGGKVIFDDMSAFLKNSMLTNTVVNIDQSTIDEVKKVEEEQDD